MSKEEEFGKLILKIRDLKNKSKRLQDLNRLANDASAAHGEKKNARASATKTATVIEALRRDILSIRNALKSNFGLDDDSINGVLKKYFQEERRENNEEEPDPMDRPSTWGDPRGDAPPAANPQDTPHGASGFGGFGGFRPPGGRWPWASRGPMPDDAPPPPKRQDRVKKSSQVDGDDFILGYFPSEIWQRMLAKTIAKQTGCHNVRIGDRDAYFGHVENVNKASEMHNRSSRSMEQTFSSIFSDNYMEQMLGGIVNQIIGFVSLNSAMDQIKTAFRAQYFIAQAQGYEACYNNTERSLSDKAAMESAAAEREWLLRQPPVQ